MLCDDEYGQARATSIIRTFDPVQLIPIVNKLHRNLQKMLLSINCLIFIIAYLTINYDKRTRPTDNRPVIMW